MEALTPVSGIIIFLVGTVIAVILFRRASKLPELKNVGSKSDSPLEDIKNDLITMNNIQREAAQIKAKEHCPDEIATQIYKDFLEVFGDIWSFTLNITNEIAQKHQIDPLVAFFKKVGDILDSNQYGLKNELQNNKAYKAANEDLMRKRVALNLGKKTKAIVQRNIDHAKEVSYGLNSSIILRGVLAEPKYRELMPAQIKTTLEGIEAAIEKSLNAMLNDLEKEWKVKINGM